MTSAIVPISILKTDLFARLDTEQQAELSFAMRRIRTNKQRQLFYEILIRKFFIKGRGFSDALNSAKEVFDDKYIDSIAPEFTS